MTFAEIDMRLYEIVPETFFKVKSKIQELAEERLDFNEG